MIYSDGSDRKNDLLSVIEYEKLPSSENRSPLPRLVVHKDMKAVLTKVKKARLTTVTDRAAIHDSRGYIDF